MVLSVSRRMRKNFAFCGKICYTVLATQTNTVSKDKATFLVKMRSRFSRSYLLRRKVCVAASGDLRFSCAASRLRTFYFVRAVLLSPFDFFQIRRKTHDENTHKIPPAADAPLHRRFRLGAHRLGGDQNRHLRRQFDLYIGHRYWCPCHRRFGEDDGLVGFYEVNKVPWDNYRTSICIVQISKAVTSIGNYAFGSCSNLAGITIVNPDCQIDDN